MKNYNSLLASFILFIFGIILISPIALQSQTQIRVVATKGQKLGGIKAGTINGINKGNIYTLKRSTQTGIMTVGEVEIIKVTNRAAVIRLIKNSGSSYIRKGDFLGNLIVQGEEEFDWDQLEFDEHFTPPTSGTFAQGKMDGERDAKGNFLWFLAGAGCGVFGVGYVYFMDEPKPASHMFMGKSQEYVLGYTEGYQNKSKKTNMQYACAGWATWILIYLVATPTETTTEY